MQGEFGMHTRRWAVLILFRDSLTLEVAICQLNLVI
jgi:hypothetical protein